MKTLELFYLLVILLIHFSCSTEPEENYIPYKIKIDKIEHPDTVYVNDTLIIKFYGFVGPDGCHRFSHFEKKNSQSLLEFTVWGEKPDYETVCSAVMVWMDGTEYKTRITQTGLYQIKIHQPDNSFMIDSVFIE